MPTTQAEYSIREFVYPDDYEEVYSLWQNAGSGIQLRRSDEPEEIRKKLSRDPDLFLLAVRDGKIIGTVIGGFDGRRGMMYHLAVAKEERRNGIAKTLVYELESRLRARGCIRYYLLVTQDNQDAVQFYEKMGCQRMPLHAFGKDL
jgi:ribosomal protein S18 acetylase RimI-like enzyme